MAADGSAGRVELANKSINCHYFGQFMADSSINIYFKKITSFIYISNSVCKQLWRTVRSFFNLRLRSTTVHKTSNKSVNTTVNTYIYDVKS